MNHHDQPVTLTVEQAGKLIGISRGSAYRALAQGTIPSIRIGRRLLVPTARLHDMLGLTDPDGTRNGDPGNGDPGNGDAGNRRDQGPDSPPAQT